MKRIIKTIIFLLVIVIVVFVLHYGTAMQGSESRPGNYLKEESFYQRYGVSPEGLVLWLDQSDLCPVRYGVI